MPVRIEPSPFFIAAPELVHEGDNYSDAGDDPAEPPGGALRHLVRMHVALLRDPHNRLASGQGIG